MTEEMSPEEFLALTSKKPSMQTDPARRRKKKPTPPWQAMESRAEKRCREMAAMGICDVIKVATPSRMVYLPGKGRVLVPTKKSTVDMVGHLAGGRAVAIELKYVSRPRGKKAPKKPWQPRFSLSNRSNFPAHEVAALDRAAWYGVLAFLLVEFEGVPDWYLYPWETIRDVDNHSFFDPSLVPHATFRASPHFLEHLVPISQRRPIPPEFLLT